MEPIGIAFGRWLKRRTPAQRALIAIVVFAVLAAIWGLEAWDLWRIFRP
jgi:hypothetical protein